MQDNNRNQVYARIKAERAEARERYKEEVRIRAMEIFPEIFRKYAGGHNMRPSGIGYSVPCPFHGDSDNSATVSSKAGFICRSTNCGITGDVFEFLQRIGAAGNFRESLELAASIASVPRPEILGGTAKISEFRKPQPRIEKSPLDDYLFRDGTVHPCDLEVIPRDNWFRFPEPNEWFKVYRPDRYNSDGSVDKPEKFYNYKPEMVHIYRNHLGDVTNIVLRIKDNDPKPKKESAEGEGKKPGKYFIPLRKGYAWESVPDDVHNLRGEMWIVQGASQGHRRPIYGMEDLRAWIANPNRGPIIVVEGEKCRDRMVKHCGRRGALILSPMGGGEAVKLMNWLPVVEAIAKANVENVRLIVWPDADPMREKENFDGTKVLINKQEEIAKTISYSFLRDMRAARADFGLEDDELDDGLTFARIVPPDGVSKGWDVDDAIKDGLPGMGRGMSGAEVAYFMRENNVPIDMSLMHEGQPDNDPEEDADHLPRIG